MLQSIDQNDPSLVSGTLTIRNVNLADAGAYSCEALNNQGFVFAVPDAIVDVNGLYFVKKSRIFYIELIFLNNSRGSNITTM